MCPRDVSRKRATPHSKRNAAAADFFLAHADCGNFRYGIDTVREEFRRRGHRQTQRMASGDTALFHRGRRQAGEADRVPGGVDMRHRGLERVRIDLDAAAIVRLDPAAAQVQCVRRTHPPGGIQDHFGPDGAAVLQRHDGMIVRECDARDRRTEPDRHAAVAQLMGEILDQFVIDELQEAFARFHQRDRHIEGGEDRGIFHPDHPTADHRQAARETRYFHDLIAIQNRGPVERHVGRTVWAGAHGDQIFWPPSPPRRRRYRG